MIKISGIIVGILLVLLIGFHFWFKAHARKMIEDLVETRSNGKLKMKVQKFRFNYFSKKMGLENVVFYNTDTVNENTTYKFTVKKINLKVKEFIPIIFQNQFLIDSLVLLSPDIQVTRLRAVKENNNRKKEDVSIPEEMGKVYNSIQDALSVLNVTRFRIKNGRFTLINKIQPDQLPVSIGNIDFHIDNIRIEGEDKKLKQKILFSDNVVFVSHDQKIIFPDGRHSLEFQEFRINLKKQIVEFDSCTIAATRTDSSSSSFNVFFDALKLININFDTLYRAEVIQADSVYCVNPKFNLTVDVEKKKGSKKPPPKLEDIVKQLTGDLLLGFVVVSNADFNIKMLKDDVPTSFTFTDNNFEMQGLSIDQGAAKPIKVKNFAMAIRNYENFIKDSTYSVQFDSVLFRDDRIYLSNFIFHKLNNGAIVNTFNIPQFYLSGLSWDALVFERKLKATQATMFNPTIHYTAPAKQKKEGKGSLFHSLGAVNDLMDLKFLDIRNGNIDLTLKKDLRIQLNRANLAIESNSLLTSTKISGIKNSLTSLNFENGLIKAGNLQIELNNIRYIGNSGNFNAGNVTVTDRSKKIKMGLQNIEVEKMKVDERTGDIQAEGITWQQGDINMNISTSNKGGAGSFINLKRINGFNTNFTGRIGATDLATKLQSVSLTVLTQEPNKTILLDGLAVNGNHLQIKNESSLLTVTDYQIKDNQQSRFSKINYKSDNEKMSASVILPSASLIPHIQPLLNGDIEIDNISLLNPVINIRQTVIPSADSNSSTSSLFPKVNITSLKLMQPVINWSRNDGDSITTLQWNGEKGNNDFLTIEGFQLREGTNLHSSIQQGSFYLSDFIFTNAKGKRFSTGNGNIAASIRDVLVDQKENNDTTGVALSWKGIVSHLALKDFQLDSIGKSTANLVVNSVDLKELQLSNSLIKNMQDLTAANKSFQLQNFKGKYDDESKQLGWSNAGFSRQTNTFSLDSFFFQPTVGRDSFMAAKDFETDYITLQTGKIKLGPVNMNRFISDNTLIISSVIVNDLLMKDYRDKTLPFDAGIIKPLSTVLIKRIPQDFSVDTFQFNNAGIEYTEVSEITKETGTVPITRITAKILNTKNYNLSATDSLMVIASGYLMDTAFLQLQVKESYSDSLGGFLMTLQLKPMDLTLLNPVLVPFASAKIKSGYLDSISMWAVGREYVAIGEMKMFYHDLKIEVLKKGTDEKRWLLTFLANTIIKNKNTSRTGNVFFMRLRDKSAINYLVKIVTSGIISSVGVKSNKKKIKKYKKELDRRKIPVLEIE